MLGLALGLAGGCAEVKHVNVEPPPSDVEDAGVDAAPEVVEGPDAGPPPSDSQCPGTWSSNSGSATTGCGARRVTTLVEADGPLDLSEISIARTPAGRVGVVFHADTDIEQGDTVLVHFRPTSPAFTPTVLRRVGMRIGDRLGYHARLGATAPDTFHLLTHDIVGGNFGDVLHFEQTGTSSSFTPRDGEVVLGGVPLHTELAFGVLDRSVMMATVLHLDREGANGAPLATLRVLGRGAEGTFAPLTSASSGMAVEDCPGAGKASIVYDGAGRGHVGFFECKSRAFSSAKHRAFDGKTWTSTTTIETTAEPGARGFDVSLALVGARKHLAYFVERVAPSGGASTSSLRIASWSTSSETPTIEVLVDGIPTPDPMNPSHRVALASDRWGLLHLAVIVPDGAGGTLTYRRQARDAAGKTRWLSDVVATGLVGVDQDGLVDMVVDEQGRPHIAFRSGKDLRIHYASRYDR